MNRWSVVTPALLMGLAACRITAAQVETPAVIVDADATSRATLQRAVDASLGLATVRLADDALTHSSVLLIERAPVYDADGLRADGRARGRPEVFTLVLHDSACVLLHARDGRSTVLEQTRCRPLSP